MSFVIEIDTTEVERAWTDGAMRGINSEVAKGVQKACDEGAREAVNTHLYEDRTTQLTASIRGNEGFEITPDGAEGQITAGEDYASYVNEWETTKIHDGFMDRAHDKAEEVLTEYLEENIAPEAERRFHEK